MIVDVYPEIGSEYFVEYAGAFAGCWVRGDTARAKGGVARAVEQALAVDGWRIARTVSTERVSSASYSGNAEGRDRFEQALNEGFVAEVNRRKREVILAAYSEQADEDTFALAAHEQFVKAIRAMGPISLCSRLEGQWANGVSPEGDEFFPIWSHVESVSAWLHGWEGYEVTPLDRDSPLDEVLHEINDATMWAAIEVGHNALMTTHPIFLSELLKGPTPRRPLAK